MAVKRMPMSAINRKATGSAAKSCQRKPAIKQRNSKEYQSLEEGHGRAAQNPAKYDQEGPGGRDEGFLGAEIGGP